MLEELQEIKFAGEVKENEDISAIVSFGNFLAIGSDEHKRKIQILEKQGSGYKVREDLEIELPVLAEEEDQEIDIEGMSISDGDTLFVIGSHSLKRLNLKDKKTYLQNRERITRVIPEDKKNSIFRLKLDSQTGQEKKKKKRKTIRIKEIIENDSVLGLFVSIPSKENGVDIEGIASDGKTLYIGFRGPVLRNNYVPVMVIKDFKDRSDYELRFLDLKGNGIRDICKVQDGFLIIAGPVGDGLAPYKLYFWDGSDTLPGKGRTKDKAIIPLGKIPPPKEAEAEGIDAKAEGITVIEETSSIYKFIIVYDGVKNGGATLFQVSKPA